MRSILFLLLSTYLFSQDFHFKGLDPTHYLVPETEVEIKNKIDTVHFGYAFDINTSLPAYYLTTKDSIGGKFISFKQTIYIHSSNDKFITGKSKTFRDIIPLELEKENSYKNYTLSYTFNLDPEEYFVYVETIDLVSGLKYFKKHTKSIREPLKDFLISDLYFRDLSTNEFIVSEKNNFGNREGEIEILFNTYQKNDSDEFYHNINMIEKKLASEKIAGFALSLTLGIVESVYESVSDLISDEPDTLMDESIFQASLKNNSKDKFKRWRFVVSKSHFNDIKFSKNLKTRNSIEVYVQTLKYVNEEVEIDDEFDEITNIDSISSEELDFYNQTFGSTTVIAGVEEVNEIVEPFSMYWEFIPQTESEMSDYVKQLSFFFDDRLDTDILDSRFVEQKHYIYSFWKKYGEELGEKNELIASKRFFKKLEFIENNFIQYQRIDNYDDAVEIPGFAKTRTMEYRPTHKFFKDTWNSDKSLTYIKHGLPDEIEGVPLLMSNGKAKPIILERPWQKWTYNDLDKTYTFVQNSFVDSRMEYRMDNDVNYRETNKVVMPDKVNPFRQSSNEVDN